MTDSIETSEADALPWAPDSESPSIDRLMPSAEPVYASDIETDCAPAPKEVVEHQSPEPSLYVSEYELAQFNRVSDWMTATIRKHPGDGRVALYTHPAQQAEPAPAGSGGWEAHAKALEHELTYWKRRAQTMHEHQKGECWYWMGDGNDHPESMVNSLPVVIRADDLQALMAPQANHDPCSHLRGQILVLANLLGEALKVVKNVEAEGGDEAELLQHIITQGDAALAAVLQEHAMGRVRHG